MCSSLVVLVQKISRRNVIDLLGGVTINQGEIYQAIRIKNNKELANELLKSVIIPNPECQRRQE